MRAMTKAILWGALILLPASAYAQGQPPIQSAQDAACRQEATRGVMSDPRGLDPYALGRQIWAQCMSRTSRVQRAHRQVRRRQEAPMSSSVKNLNGTYTDPNNDTTYHDNTKYSDYTHLVNQKLM